MADIGVIQSPGGVRADAKSRSLRTLVMGFLFDLLATLSIVLAPHLADLDISSKAQWMVIGSLVIKTILTSAISYLARLKIAPNEPNQISLASAKWAIQKKDWMDRIDAEKAGLSPEAQETVNRMQDYIGRG